LQKILENDKIAYAVSVKKIIGTESSMLNVIKVNLSRQEIIGAVKAMRKQDRETFLEELLSATSPEYLKSIKEARRDYKAGRIKKHDEVFGH